MSGFGSASLSSGFGMSAGGSEIAFVNPMAHEALNLLSRVDKQAEGSFSVVADGLVLKRAAREGRFSTLAKAMAAEFKELYLALAVFEGQGEGTEGAEYGLFWFESRGAFQAWVKALGGTGDIASASKFAQVAGHINLRSVTHIGESLR